MRNLFSKFCVHFVFLFLTSSLAMAAGVAEVDMIKGDVDVRDARGQMKRLKRGDRLSENDVVVTGASGRVKLLFVEGGDKGRNVVVLGANSRLQIQRASIDPNDPGTKLFLEQGTARSHVNRKYKGEGADVFEVHTPNAVAGVRGTVFQVEYDRVKNASTVATLRGLVAVRMGMDANVMVRPQEFTRVIQGAVESVREIRKDAVLKQRIENFDRGAFRNEDAGIKNDQSQNSRLAPSKSVLHGSSTRPMKEHREMEKAQRISQQTGIPVEKALDMVRVDTTTDKDREKAVQRISGGLVGGVGGAELEAAPVYVKPLPSKIDNVLEVRKPVVNVDVIENPVLNTGVREKAPLQAEPVRMPTNTITPIRSISPVSTIETTKTLIDRTTKETFEATKEITTETTLDSGTVRLLKPY